MIRHVVTAADWNAHPEQPYGPASLAEDGFVHCSPDEATTLSVVNAFYRDAPRPLLVLLLDEERLASRVEWEEGGPRTTARGRRGHPVSACVRPDQP